MISVNKKGCVGRKGGCSGTSAKVGGFGVSLDKEGAVICELEGNYKSYRINNTPYKQE